MKQISIILLMIISTLGSANCGSHASIKSVYGQLVTSSTLRWRHFNGETLPAEAVSSGTGKTDRAVCRAEHHGSLLIGQTIPVIGGCAVGFVNKTFKKRKYEILINVDRAARLEWRTYNKFSGVPEGTVAGVDSSGSADQFFIGRHLTSDGRYLPGVVQISKTAFAFGILRVWDESGVVQEHPNGDVLVELEPESYELDLEPSNRNPKKTSQDVVLTKSSLFRFDEGKDILARLQKVLSYEYEKSEYYGQIPGMIRALPTTVHLSNGQIQSILWGLPEKSTQEETLMIGHELGHFSAVDVSVVGVRITEEEPYSATLISIFSDGSRIKRKVNGILQRRFLDHIRPEYSRVYQIKDSTAASSSTLSSTTADSGESRKPSRFTENKDPNKEIMMSDQRLASSSLQDSAFVSAASTTADSAITIDGFFLISLILARVGGIYL